MKIGIITLSRIKVNQGAFYNLQDVGMAKAFAKAGHKVILYRLTEDADKTEQRGGVTMIFKKTPGIGRQALTGFSFLAEELERLICFSDNQVSFPALHQWCGKKNILLQPYVGVIKSNSSHFLIFSITDLLVERNIRRYRRMKVYAKTPFIQEQLAKKGIGQVTLLPVCLDMDLLHQGGTDDAAEKISLRRQWGYDKQDKILLFIGRMEPEKEPLEMLELLKKLRKQNDSYKLLMIGQGILLTKVQEQVKRQELTDSVKIVAQLLNQEIWQAYTISDCFVNLNRHEIYGMSILEALYYKCPVVARRAPGPEYILRDICPSGLCGTQEQIAEGIQCSVEQRNEEVLIRQREWVIQKYSWDMAIQELLRC